MMIVATVTPTQREPKADTLVVFIGPFGWWQWARLCQKPCRILNELETHFVLSHSVIVQRGFLMDTGVAVNSGMTFSSTWHQCLIYSKDRQLQAVCFHEVWRFVGAYVYVDRWLYLLLVAGLSCHSGALEQKQERKWISMTFIVSFSWNSGPLSTNRPLWD